MTSIKNKNLDVERWAIRLCALAMVTGLYLTVRADEKDKNNVPLAVTTSTCAVLGGIGVGMAGCKLFNRDHD